MLPGASRRDNLRLMSARDATQLAYDKWTKLAFGGDALEDPRMRQIAINAHDALTDALAMVNGFVRT